MEALELVEIYLLLLITALCARKFSYTDAGERRQKPKCTKELSKHRNYELPERAAKSANDYLCDF